MDKEMKGCIIEIITMTIILIIIVPICVRASNEYTRKQEALLSGLNTTIDITNKEGNKKELNLYTNNNDTIKLKLGLKISKFYNEYQVEINGVTYNLNDLEYYSDDLNRYYILGVYEINKEKSIDFELKTSGKNYYEESLTYSFYTEGII